MSDRPATRLESIDLIKALALLWIFFNHVAEAMWGHPWFGNPDDGWPRLAERWAQLTPMDGSGVAGLGANALRYVGWSGDQAVGWFILLSGFVLSMSQLRRSDAGQVEDSLGDFYGRRLRRILPTWWAVHLLILLPIALLGWKITIADPRFFFSLMGIRITPDQMYFGIPAWWFIGLLLQLYLVFPFLHRLYLRLGPGVGVCILIIVSFAARAWGMGSTVEWIDAWNRGSIFLSRMAEFASGMWLAFALHKKTTAIDAWKQSWRLLFVAAALFLVGNAASFTFWGMVPAPWLMSVGGVLLAFQVLQSRPWKLAAPLLDPPIGWIGRHSLSLFLVHQPIMWFLLRNEADTELARRMLMRMAAGVAITIAVTMFVEWFAAQLIVLVERGSQRWGIPGLLLRCTTAIAVIVLAVLPFELAVRKYDPQDITDFGWSERPSLIADDALGYRLRPSAETRLRWESYDYVVIANAEGFPGPELPGDKPAGTFRIMTVGDAFTSAEGVDTNQSWPRLLESKLMESREADETFEVINFGITGFGPNQYATLVKRYAPRLQPDLIIIGWFTNDYVDVQATNQEFQEMVGFDKPPGDTWLAWLTGRHLSRYVRGNVAEAIVENVTGEPCSHTRFFCQSDLFDRSNVEYVSAGVELVRQRFGEIRRMADETGASVCVMSIPAPIQVVPIEQLHYIRTCLNLKDERRYDYDQPQRLTGELTHEFGFQHFDLRPALGATTARHPYQSRNLHFTEAGHDVVSDAMVPVVRRYLTGDGT